MKCPIAKTVILPILFIVLFSSAAPAFQLSREQVFIEGTSLRLILPANWELGPSKLENQDHTLLRYRREPSYEIVVSEFAKWPDGLSVPVSLPFECDFLLGVFRKTRDGSIATLNPRPEYFPQEYYSRVLVSQSSPPNGNAQMTACLFLGRSSLTVNLRPIPTETQLPDLTEMLQAIVKAGKEHSSLLYAPGQIHLPVLNVSASLSSGSWGIGKQTFPQLGELDLLVRTGGTSEAKLAPILWKGECTKNMNPSSWANFATRTDQPVTARRRENPSYISSKWQPIAFELPFPPEAIDKPVISRLQVTTCRQLDVSTGLLVLIWYGSEQISEADAPWIAKSLDEIADASLRGPKGDGVMYLPPLTFPNASSGGSHDFGTGGTSEPGTESDVVHSLRVQVAAEAQQAHLTKRIAPVYPPLARQTRVSGTVKLRAIIDKDGSVLELKTISGHPLLIQSALDAVKQWQYQPTLLNGHPVMVDTEIDVVFALSQ